MKYVQEKTEIQFIVLLKLFILLYSWYSVGEKIFGVYLVKKNYFNYIFTYIFTSYNLPYF